MRLLTSFKKFEIFTLLFFLYSFLGWCMEVVRILTNEKKLVNRGVLVGPYCPIYGCGVLAITVLLEKYRDDFVATFIFAILICALLEYFTSYLLEKIFGARWWDYSDRKMNINGRICLENLTAFGLLGCYIVYISNPILVGLLELMNPIVMTVLTFSLIAIFTLDMVTSFAIITNLQAINKDYLCDNTEEISRRVRRILKRKLLLHIRLLKAYPRLKDVIKFEEKSERLRKRIAEYKEKRKMRIESYKAKYGKNFDIDKKGKEGKLIAKLENTFRSK